MNDDWTDERWKNDKGRWNWLNVAIAIGLFASIMLLVWSGAL